MKVIAARMSGGKGVWERFVKNGRVTHILVAKSDKFLTFFKAYKQATFANIKNISKIYKFTQKQ